MFITLGDCRGVIIADEPNQCIEVKLTHRNEDARNLLQWIRSNIEAIEKSQINANTEKKLPYLEEIALFDTDYSHAIGYESYQRVERSYKKEIKNLNLEVIDSKTGEIYDKDFDVSELLGLYQDNKIRQFSPHSLLEFLTQSLLRLTDFRSKIINEQEDDINDRVRESLSSRGYIIADQSRGGFSNSGKGAGERDIVVLNQYGQQATLIEAMILKSAVKKTIAEHYKKLTVNYNTHGNPVDFLITYAKVKNFNNLWKKYKAEFEDFIDLSDIRSNKSNIKIGHTSIKLDNSDQVRIIYHIMVNFGVKVDH
jgi:hypothetical protein